MIGAILSMSLGLSAIAAPPVAPEVAQVQEWLDSWTGLSGRFEQRLASPTLPTEQVESGVFYIARPDRMRWDFDQPEKKLALTDGEHTWLYVPSDRQVIRGLLEDVRQDSAVALLLSGALRLEEAFVVQKVRLEGRTVHLELVPRHSSEAIATVTVVAGQQFGDVQGFTVIDPSGNQVTWHLTDLELDPELSDRLFTFDIPRGVEVQDLGAEPSSNRKP